MSNNPDITNLPNTNDRTHIKKLKFKVMKWIYENLNIVFIVSIFIWKKHQPLFIDVLKSNLNNKKN